jgi:Lipocalin-like domain
MTGTAADLIGAWRLESWSVIYDDGRPVEFPLGPDAVGIIMYTASGEVSATIMRTGRSRAAPAKDTEMAKAFSDSFAYAGRYEVRNGTAYHSIEIATNPALIGLTSTRHIKLEGNRLILSGPDFSAGSRRTQQIVWQRSSSRS